MNKGTANAELRALLLDCMISTCTSAGLSDWLSELGADTRGTKDQKEQRIREHSAFLRASPQAMIAEAIDDFRNLDSGLLALVCEKLGVRTAGSTKPRLLLRLHYLLAVEEQLLSRPSVGQIPTVEEVYRAVDWYPLHRARSYERDLYDDFFETMAHVFGAEFVHSQRAVAHGTVLKIDFHMGSGVPGQGGVGVEFKMPASNSDVQKAIGQLGQYQNCYGQSLIVAVFPDLVQPKHLQPLFHDLTTRGIAYVVKRPFSDALEA